MTRKRADIHTISGGFVFLLLGLFAVISTFLVGYGVRAYRLSVQTAEVHSEQRILSSYVRSMVRGADESRMIAAQTIDGIDTLSIYETYDDAAYVTRIYCYEGMLREWFSAAERSFAPEDGSGIIAASSFSAKIANGLLTVTVIAARREKIEVQIALYAAQDEEAKRE